MTRRLVATFTSKTGRHSAKVYRVASANEFHTTFHVNGVKSQGADAVTESKAEALEVTQWSLMVADDMHAAMQARAQASPAPAV